MLKFPYGISDFHRLVTGHYFYVDRPAQIRWLEDAGDQLLLLRPRRFGKSLLLSMLENYYDVAKAGEFEPLFGHLAIGANPTPKHNQYFVMKWDFSVVRPHGEVPEIRHALHRYLNRRIQDFAEYYQPLLHSHIPIEPQDATISERLQELLLPDSTARLEVTQLAELFYQTGQLQPLCDFIESHPFSVFDNRDSTTATELVLKAVCVALLFNSRLLPDGFGNRSRAAVCGFNHDSSHPTCASITYSIFSWSSSSSN